jgi:AbrB family looped-hinge helix DNA binding protein
MDRSILLSSYELPIDPTMDAVSISPKFQIVIPRKIREALGLVAGQKVQVVLYDGRIELIPVKPAKKMRGFLKGIDTRVPREKDRA